MNVPVLIVGGGPVGLATAVFLGRHGIQTVLVEKRADTSLLPRAPGLQSRTLELFRAAGIGPDIRALEIGDSHAYFEGGILKVDTFADIDDAVVLEAPVLDGPTVSPERVMGCGQDRYERILVEKAGQFGGQVLFSTALRTFEQDDDGVTAVVEDTETGREVRIRARYLVGADGVGSRVRTTLGVPRHGRGTVFNALSIYFRAPRLTELLKDAKFILCYATARGSMMGLSRLHGRDPWLAAPLYYPERGEKPDDFTDERCVDILRAAAGRDIDIEIVDKVPWTGAQLVAERFRIGRVFLAGDAGHAHPPAGGFGANTGIHDAHNLAWKLAAVLHGWAGDRLLDTYDDERHQVGNAMAEQALARSRIRHGHGTEQERAVLVDDVIITLGYRYLSSAVVGSEDDRVFTPRLELTGEPGTRAPHVWLDRDGERMSTIDLFWDSFVLLHGPDGGAWARAATEVAARARIPLVCHEIGPSSALRPSDWDWAAAYGVKSDGAVLVRPDAFVGWRSTERATDPAAVLTPVFSAVAGLDSA